MKQLPVDLVILNEKGASQAQELQALRDGKQRCAQQGIFCAAGAG